MSVTLITPSTRATSQRPPLGLMCMASYLESNGVRTDLIDEKGSLPREEIDRRILAKVNKSKSGLVGLTCLTPELDSVMDLCKRIKEGSPDKKIVLGGVHTTVMPQDVLFKKSPVDFVVFGEGEETLFELAKSLENATPLKSVKGIGLYDGKKVVRTEPRPFIKDLDEMPLPAFDKIDMEFYTKPDIYCIRGIPVSGFYVFTSRGCPFRCKFCVNKSIFGGLIRFKSPARAVEEMEYLVKKYKIDGLYIYDDTFAVNKKQALGICSEIKERSLDIIWACETRVHLVEEPLFKKMKDAGCVQVDFGIESGSQAVLDRLNKGITVEQTRNAIRICKKLGIRQFANFLINTPGETEEDLKKTFDLARELDATVSIFNITTPFVGTELYDLVGGVPKEDYAKLAPSPSTYSDWINLIQKKYRMSEHKTDLVKLNEEIYKEFPSIHGLSFKNKKQLKSLVKNLAFLTSPKYVKVMLKSKRKMQYLKWVFGVRKVLQSQTFKAKNEAAD